MMDPGTAVGVASLGIQVCEGLLKYYRDWKGYEDDIRETCTEIADLSKTFGLLSDTLQRASPNALAQRAQECLTTTQEGVQQLEKKRKKLHREAPTGLRHKVQAGGLRLVYPLRKSTLEKLKEIVQVLIQQLDLAMQVILLDNSSSIQATTAQIEHKLENVTDLTTQIAATTLDTKAQLSDAATNIKTLLSAEEARTLDMILEWLAAPDPSINHRQACDKYEPGTGEWFLKSQDYQDWVSGPSPLLWLHGKAGCCKTVLCSTIIEKVQCNISEKYSTAFAYFYFSFSDERKQTYADMLLSVVTQLSRDRHVHPLLKAAYEKHHPHEPSAHVLEGLLQALLEEAPIPVLVFDALDECTEEQRGLVVEGLKRITYSVPNTRILLTSRRESDIVDLMADWCENQLAINESGVNADIDIFVQKALATDRKLMCLPTATKKEIADMFHEKSDGMFRWAALQLQSIRSLKILRPAYVSAALYAMPRTLDKTYERVLTSIDDLYFEEARTALEWLALSTRPLTVAEMAEVCSIRLDNNGEPSLDEGGHVALLGLLGVISSLVLVEMPQEKAALHDDNSFGEPYPEKYDSSCYRQTIRLAHFSVKEFLVSTRLQQSDAGLSRYALSDSQVHSSLSQSCCAYFLYFTNGPSIKIWIQDEKDPKPGKSGRGYGGQDYLKEFTPFYPLLPYVCTQWTHHQRLAESSKQQFQTHTSLHMRILADERLRVSWLRLTGRRISAFANENSWHPLKYRLHFVALGNWHDNTTSLYWAAILGLQQTVSWICASASPQDIRNPGGVYHTAAHCAAYCGDERILETLMESGADVHCEGGVFRTILQAAAFSGNPKVVEVLLKNGADVRCEGGRYGTAVLAAAVCGHTEIVLQLLRADPGKRVLNFRSNEFGTALEAAASKGNECIVEALLQAGADHRKAMVEAVRQGHTGVGRILINHGADLDIYMNDFKVPAEHTCWILPLIHFAVGFGSEEMVAMLIQAGADVTTLSKALLLSAAEVGSMEKFEMLVEAGVHIDRSSEDLLVGAARGGAVSIVEVLLQAGFTVVGKHVPLIAAAEVGSEGMVKLLLKAGADIHGRAQYDSLHGHEGNALIAAAANGNVVILSHLLDAGVYPEDEDYSQGPWSRSHKYSNRGWWSCKQIALMRAIEFWEDHRREKDASSRCAIMIQKLIDAGADIHTGNGAAFMGRNEEAIMKLVQVLLTNGANIDAQENSNFLDYIKCRPSILYKAIDTNITKLVQLLLDHGADVNGYGWTRYSPEYLATHGLPDDSIEFMDRYDSILLGGIRTGNVKMVKLLLEGGADVKTLGAAEARTLIAATWKHGLYDPREDSNRVAILSMILDRMLEMRGIDDPVFDDDEDALRRSMKRFSKYHEMERESLTETKDLIRERRAVFMNK
ncbi:hypothetical protein BKA63DRAFT_600355 [Paraphoma chrysanthemicola]|nr:hypothetical protein BKA63DRAFT_600355 [Paraphoma chrysanthemicola]